MKLKKIKYNPIWYAVMRLCTRFLARVRFNVKYLRNELSGKRGPIVVIANHQAAFDFVNVYSATRRRISMVASNSFYQTLPIKGLMPKVGVIPKQQFQTTPSEMRAMKRVVDGGGILCIYPAGLMCEDGLSTPIPEATWKFLQWLGADVYVARSTGTYFCTPKWSKIKRRGRTFVDIYKLLDKDELASLDDAEIKEKAFAALDFDAYRENDELKIEYKNGDNIEGLENVLYLCPHCGREYTVRVRNTNEIYCTECGFAERSDRCGMLTSIGKVGEEIRYVSDWARLILSREREKVLAGDEVLFDEPTEIHTVDIKAKRFKPRGEGRLILTRESVILRGTLSGEPLEVVVHASSLPSLPFKPGICVEVQSGADIYRCMLRDGRLAMKYINLLKSVNSLAAEREAAAAN